MPNNSSANPHRKYSTMIRATDLTCTLGLLLAAIAIAPHSAQAEPPEDSVPPSETLYTALGGGTNGELWVASAVKGGETRMPKPQLERFASGSKDLEKPIVLNTETFEGREVQAIFTGTTPKGEPALMILSQWSVEQGDQPQLHGIAVSKLASNQQSDWIQLSTAPCTDVEKITLAEKSVSYLCAGEQELDPKTKMIITRPVDPKLKTPRPLVQKDWSIPASSRGTFKIPAQEASTGKPGSSAALHGRLVGPAWGWNQLIVRSTGKIQKILFKKKLTAPGDTPSK